MARLAVFLVLGLLAHCSADLGDDAGSGDTDLVLLETGAETEAGGADFVDPADFVGSEVTERQTLY